MARRQHPNGKPPNPKGNPKFLAPPWKPGQSGNPKGPVSQKPFMEALRKALAEDNKDRLRKSAEMLLTLASRGEPWAVQMLCERLDGKAPQTIKMTLDVREMSIDEILGELTDTRAELEEARVAAGIVFEDAIPAESGGVH